MKMARRAATHFCAIVAWAAISLAGASPTRAATGSGPVILPPPTNTLRIGAGSGAYAGKVIVMFDVDKPVSWSYDPRSGRLSQLGSYDPRADRLSQLSATVKPSRPIAAITLAVQKYDDAAMPPPNAIGPLNSGGVAKFNPYMSHRIFYLVVWVPAYALKQGGNPGSTSKAAALKFELDVGGNGVVQVLDGSA
jgi:hypothetical protein